MVLLTDVFTLSVTKQLLFALSFLCLLSTIRANDQLTPKELGSLLHDFKKERNKTILLPIESQIDELNTNYLRALGNAFDKATDNSDLDAALEIELEQKRIKNGLPIKTGEKPKSHNVLRLQNVYLAELRKIKASRDKLNTELKGALTNALMELQRSLVKQKRIGDAQKVRAFREGEKWQAYFSLQSSPVQATAPPDSNASETSEDPEVLCRIVIVEVHAPSPDKQGVIPFLATDQDTDWVRIGKRVMANRFAGIKANGDAVMWELSEKRVLATNCQEVLNHHRVPPVTLGEDKKLTIHGDFERKDMLESINSVQQVDVDDGVILALDGEGQLHSAGTRSTLPAFQAMVAASQREPFANIIPEWNTGFVLTASGNLECYDKEGNVTSHNNFTKVLQTSGIHRNGSYHYFGFFNSSVQDLMQFEDLEMVESVSFRNWCGITKSKRGWRFYTKNLSTGTWKHDELYDKALANAVDVTPFGSWGNHWFVALVPAASVPRSGLWKLDELSSIIEQQ